MRLSPLVLGTLVAPLLAMTPAAAQPAPAPPSPAAPAPPAAQKPPAIDVSDPLLAPVPPAPHRLASFGDALAIVTSRSTDLRIAEQEIERAQGISRQALALSLPQITANGSIVHHLVRGDVTTPTFDFETFTAGTKTTTVPPTPTALAQLTVAQPILAPRAWYGVGTSERTVEVARRSYEDRRRTILGAVAGAIVAVVTAERVAEVNRVGLRSSLERLELMQRRLRVGSGTTLDIVRAQQDVTLARANLITGDESLRKTREALGLTLGSGEPYGVSPDISIEALEKTAREICAPADPSSRADVVAARTQLDVAERNVTDVTLGYAPTAEVSSTLSYSSEQLASAKNYAWSIQGVLSIPIWDGGARYGATRSARAQVKQQRDVVEATLRAATIEATQAFREVGVAARGRDLSRESAALARESARLSQVAFDAGAGTSFELVESARRQREAELDLAVKEFQLVSANITALLAAANCTY